MFTNFQLRKVYNFDMYNPAQLGSSYKGAVVLAIMDFDSAARELDIQTIHTSSFSYFPQGTPNDPRQYDYIKIKTASGATTILGMAWIKEDTVVVVDSRTITATIADVGPGDIARVRNALIQNGFNSVNVTISS